ncbi:MAG: helix-turn-helix transcriptional regulator [Granulosicoccaceae bacterium]
MDNHIRKWRRAQGWTQADLAEKLGCSQSRVSQIEKSGLGDFSISLARKLARVFSCSIDDLFV